MLANLVKTDEKGRKTITLTPSGLEDFIQSLLPDGMTISHMCISEQEIDRNGDFLELGIK